MVLSWFVTNSFTVVYGAAIDTLFVCMLHDETSSGGDFSVKHAAARRAFMEVRERGDKDDHDGAHERGEEQDVETSRLRA